MQYMPYGPTGQYLQEMLVLFFMYDLTSRFPRVPEDVLTPYAQSLGWSVDTGRLEKELYQVYLKIEKLNEPGHIYQGKGAQP